MFNPKENPLWFLAALAAIGAFIGLGKLLASAEVLSARLVFGRMMASAGIGAAAGATTLMFPLADPIVLLGVAAALASAGSSTIEYILKRKSGGNPSE